MLKVSINPTLCSSRYAWVVLWKFASTRKRLNTEMPQKKSGNPSKTGFFETFPQFLQEKRKSLKTQFLRGFLFILRRFLKFLRGFRFSPDNYFWGISQYFWGISQYFWGISEKFLRRFRFLKKVLKLYFVEAFPLFLRRFRFFLRRFRFLKKLLKLYFVEAFPLFLRRFRFLKKVFKLYFVEAFPLFIEAFPCFL